MSVRKWRKGAFMRRGARWALLGSGASLVVVLAVVRPGSPVVAFAGDKNTIGNGTGNHSAVSIQSPTFNRGPLAVSNTNAGGRTSTRAAFCGRKYRCLIVQR